MRNSHIIEGQAISAKWRSLTHRYINRPPAHPGFLVEQMAKVFDKTGSFQSPQQSLKFVRAIAFEGLESIVRLSLRLEAVFRVEIMSSDMAILFEDPGTWFEGARMINEFDPDGVPTPGTRDRIAGTTEVGIWKSVWGGVRRGSAHGGFVEGQSCIGEGRHGGWRGGVAGNILSKRNEPAEISCSPIS